MKILTLGQMPEIATWFVLPHGSVDEANDWIMAPCSNCGGDKSALQRANYETMTLRLTNIDPSWETIGVVEYPHWDLGWVEFVFVKPGSEAHAEAEAIREEIEKKFCLDSALWDKYLKESEEGRKNA